MKTLRPYQEKGVQFLIDRRFAILADEMGLGKTAQAICAAKTLPGRKLIVAPLSVCHCWVREIQTWAGEEALIVPRQKSPLLDGIQWVIVPWTSALARIDLSQYSFAVIILDECHRAKNKSSLQTKAVLGKRRFEKKSGTDIRYGIPSLSDNADRTWALSGTPLVNRPIDLQQLLYVGGNLAWAAESIFVKKYCLRHNRFTTTGFDNKGASNLDELRKNLAPYLLRRTSKDVPGELPSLTITTIPFNVKKQPVISNELSNYILTSMHQGVSKSLDEGFRSIATYRKEMGIRKAELVAEWVNEHIDDGGGPLVVFAHHHEVVDALHNLIKHKTICVTGGTPGGSRIKAVDDFISHDGPTVFIGTIGTCGTGLDGLHKRTTTCVFAELPWTPSEIQQSIGRVRRIGGVNDHTNAYILIAKESLEARICKILSEKISIIDEVMLQSDNEGQP